MTVDSRTPTVLSAATFRDELCLTARRRVMALIAPARRRTTRHVALAQQRQPHAIASTVPIASALPVHLRELAEASGGVGLIFGRGPDEPFAPVTVNSRAQRTWRRAGLDPIGLHECRHTFASFMIAAGVNAKALSVYMGHASVTITFDLYGHLMPGNEQEAARLLDVYPQHSTRAAGKPRETDRRLERSTAASSGERRSGPPGGAPRRKPSKLGVSAPVERRGRDSNPRSGGAGLRFSRPVHSTALPPLRGNDERSHDPTRRRAKGRGRCSGRPSLHFGRPRRERWPSG
jgi:Phage integrase family